MRDALRNKNKNPTVHFRRDRDRSEGQYVKNIKSTAHIHSFAVPCKTCVSTAGRMEIQMTAAIIDRVEENGFVSIGLYCIHTQLRRQLLAL